MSASVSRRFLLVLTLTFLAFPPTVSFYIVSVWADSSPLPIARFDWRMNPRFPTPLYDYTLCYLNPGSYNWTGGRSDGQNGANCPTRPWTVTFNATASTGTARLTYTWTMQGGKCPALGSLNQTTNPIIPCTFATLGNYTVQLTVTDGGGQISATATQKVALKDLLIVSIGDSLASGEGNPDAAGKLLCNNSAVSSVDDLANCAKQNPGKVLSCLAALVASTIFLAGVVGVATCLGLAAQSLTYVSPLPVSPLLPNGDIWQDQRCHRSANAGPALAAQMIERNHPHESVTFLSLACSGAGIMEGLLAPYSPCWNPAVVGPFSPPCPLIPYQMAYIPPPPYGPPPHPLPPQVSEVARLLCPVNLNLTNGTCPKGGRTIDALTISAGANDAHFGAVLELCAVIQSCQNPPFWLLDLGGLGLILLLAWFAIQLAVKQNPLDTPTISTLLNLKHQLDTLSDPVGGGYKLLNDAITSQLDVKTVYVTEYPDPTHNGNIPDGSAEDTARALANYAGAEYARIPGAALLGGVVAAAAQTAAAVGATEAATEAKNAADAGSCVVLPEIGSIKSVIVSILLPSLPLPPGFQSLAQRILQISPSDLVPGLNGITPDATDWLFNNFLTPLNGALQQSAGLYGWRYVGGMMKGTFSHGICASDRYFNNLFDSLIKQQDIWGQVHPNHEGQELYADRLYSEITDVPPSFTVVTTDLSSLIGLPFALLCVLSRICRPSLSWDQPGDNGWFIGHCDQFNSTDCLPENVHPNASFIVQATMFSGYGCPPSLNPSQCGPFSTSSLSINGTPMTYSIPGPHRVPFWKADCSSTPGVICHYDYPSFCTLGSPCFVNWYIAIVASGTYNFDFSAIDHNGVSTSFSYDVKADFDNPTASASVTSGTLGNNGWYRSGVNVTITASDAPGGSGLRHIDYKWDNFNSTGLSGVNIYNATDGIHALSYQALDFAGRRSPIANLTVKIDATPPVITSPQQGQSFLLRQKVSAVFNCADATSGVATCTGSVTTLDTSTVGPHSYTVTSTDNAGNQATLTVNYNVLTPKQALQLISNQVNTLQSAGVLNSGQARSLLVKLEHAIGNLNTGDRTVACNQLNSFINEVHAYAASGILTPAQASMLLDGPIGVIAIMKAIPC